jgi:hypothetical protein
MNSSDRNEVQDKCILLLFFRASGSDARRICSGQGKKSKILIVKIEAAGTKPTVQDLPDEMF